ncbi:MAG: sigma-70 family RNA polymerase sigma factor [Lachnospiraceae bacterium]|nr:sigma-70 family RNA polymerase sigma factor [Lachnospiraceae bacterium]
MDDKQIIDLYFVRDEQAIVETEQKYGRFCWRIAMNVLGVREDAEECVSDTYLSAWKQIPPTVPESFKAFLGRIVRNLSISRFRTMRAKKRYNGMEVLLSELGDCVPSDQYVEQTVEAKELSGYISEWLDSLPAEDSALFVRRYWFGDAVQELAEKCGITAAQMAQRMLRLRKGLRSALEQKGVAL